MDTRTRKNVYSALAGLIALNCFAESARAEDDQEPTTTISAAYTGDVWSNRRGGLKKGERYLDDLSVTAQIDADAAFGLEGGTFFFYGLMNNGATLSDTLVGDAQVISNIDTPYAARLYEAWYEQAFADDKASLKVGLYDLNSEFDAMDVASLFINSSHGIGSDYSQTGLNGPSIFPVTSLAARLQAQVSENVTLRAAVLDAAPGSLTHPKRTAIKLNDGALLAGEIEATWGDTVAAFGLWHYTSKFDDLEDVVPATGNPRRRGGNTGGYAEIEQKLISSHHEDGGLYAFGRVGLANSSINQFGSYAGAGIRYIGLMAEEDSLGFAVAHARNGDTFRRVQAAAGSPVRKAETNFELTYHIPVAPWLAIQPDIQYVVNPGTDPALRNAVVLGLRFELSFEKGF